MPPTWEDAFDLGEWPIVEATSSVRFLKRLSNEFEEKRIDHIVVAVDQSEDARGYDIRVQAKDTHAAEIVLSELYEKIETLQQHAESLSSTDQREEELETYDLLIDLVPGKPAAIYNRASVLYELGNREAAVDGLLDAMALGMPEENLSKYRGNSTGLFQMSLTSRGAKCPDYFEDIEAYLRKIEPEMPEHIPLLHGLATLSRIENKESRAAGYYTRILDIDPTDQVAKTNLALLESEEETE
jgi:tetratricopeptide (TPR) repeat protein